jgi:hypothetical protein
MANKKEKVITEEIGSETVESPVEIETVKVKLTANVKLNEDRFSLGEEIEVSQEDYDALLKAGVIDAE